MPHAQSRVPTGWKLTGRTDQRRGAEACGPRSRCRSTTARTARTGTRPGQAKARRTTRPSRPGKGCGPSWPRCAGEPSLWGPQRPRLTRPASGRAAGLGPAPQLVPFLWPRTSKRLRVHIIVAFILLMSVRVLNIYVPIYQKIVVDDLAVRRHHLRTGNVVSVNSFACATRIAFFPGAGAGAGAGRERGGRGHLPVAGPADLRRPPLPSGRDGRHGRHQQHSLVPLDPRGAVHAPGDRRLHLCAPARVRRDAAVGRGRGGTPR